MRPDNNTEQGIAIVSYSFSMLHFRPDNNTEQGIAIVSYSFSMLHFRSAMLQTLQSLGNMYPPPALMPPTARKLLAAPEVGEVAVVQAAFAHQMLGLAHSNKAGELQPFLIGSNAEGWVWWDGMVGHSCLGKVVEAEVMEEQGSSSGATASVHVCPESSSTTSRKEVNVRFRCIKLPSQQGLCPEPAGEHVSGPQLTTQVLGPVLQMQLDLVYGLAMHSGFIVQADMAAEILTGQDQTCMSGLQCSPHVLRAHLYMQGVQPHKYVSAGGRKGKSTRNTSIRSASNAINSNSSGWADSGAKSYGGSRNSPNLRSSSSTRSSSARSNISSSSKGSSTSSQLVVVTQSGCSSSSKVLVTPELVQLMAEVGVLSGASAEIEPKLELRRHLSKCSADVMPLLEFLLTRLDVDQTREVVRRIRALLLRLILAHVKANSWNGAENSRTLLLLERLPETIRIMVTADGKAPGELRDKRAGNQC
jgi:hypothetical protein